MTHQDSDRCNGTDWTVVASFWVNGEPKAQPRARFNRNSGHAYNPDSADAWKDAIKWQAKKHLPKAPIMCACRVWLDFYFPRPKRLMTKLFVASPIEHHIKPDRDNLDKAVLDALKDIGFMKDDCQVCGGEIRKQYTAKSGYGNFENPGCWITIESKKG